MATFGTFFELGGRGALEALARSGVGTLTFVEGDDVAVSNLNRQLIALENTVGMAKVEAGPVPDVPMIFFTTTGYMPEDPEKWCSLPDKYTGGTAENNRCACGHYVHVEYAADMADAVRRMAAEISAQEEES